MALFLPLPVSIVCSCMCTPVFRSISPAILSPSVTGFLSCPSPTINLATSGEWGSAVSGLSQGGWSEAELQPKSSWCIFAIKSGINIYPNPPTRRTTPFVFRTLRKRHEVGFEALLASVAAVYKLQFAISHSPLTQPSDLSSWFQPVSASVVHGQISSWSGSICS